MLHSVRRRRPVRRTAAALAAGAWIAGAGAPPASAGETAPRPNAVEQYAIEVLNRTRADPAREAQRFRIDLNEGIDPPSLTPEPREPLAVNFELIAAARAHNRDLFRNFSQLPADHRGSDGLDPTGRAQAAGASFVGGVAENNAWASQSSAVPTSASVNALHTLLFKDFTPTFQVIGRGHRKVMLNGTRDEVGVAVSGGVFGGKTAAIVTQDFVTTSRLHVLGVVYADKVTKDRFYTPGEGLGRATIEVVRQGDGARFVTQTWGAGGYQVEVGPGTYDLTASGGGLPEPQTVTGVVVTDANVKRDFVTDRTVPFPKAPAFAVTSGSATRDGSGAWALRVTKATLLVGSFTLTEEQAAQVTVHVGGAQFFAPADRAASQVTTTPDAALGGVRRLRVRDAAGNSFAFDVRTGAFSMKLRSVPGLDPAAGPILLQIDTGGAISTASVDAPTKAVGKSGGRFLLTPATGTFASQ
jgi:hypothetical protein